MAKPIMSKRKAHLLSLALFFGGLVLISFLKTWWPSIMLVVGLPIALKQYLLGRRYDMIVSLIVFIGVFITVQFKIKWEILLPILFTIGGLYIFFREFFGPKEYDEPEEEELLNKEIEEEEEK